MKAQALLVIVAVSMVGCGGGETVTRPGSVPEAASERRVSAGPVHKRGGDSVEAEVGAGGGTLELANGARLEIPPGSFEEPTAVVLKHAPATTAFLNQEDLEAVGPIVLVTPEVYGSDRGQIVFSVPLASLPAGYSAQHLQIANEQPSDAQRNYAENTTTTVWHYDRAAHEGGRAVARFSELPGLRLQFVVSK